MWNDTDHHLALLITFRCRGTWLHGDERGSVDRHNNVFGTPRIPANEEWLVHNKSVLVGRPSYLTAKRRRIIERAIGETCSIRDWDLHAINVRTNHVHAVVAAGYSKPGMVLHALKANATREMRENACWNHDYSPWVDKGSKRRLWNERHIQSAIDYVLYGQGEELPEFD